MPFSRREVDTARPPVQFDALIDWFERFSYELVLLEGFTLDEIRAVLDAFEHVVRAHLGETPQNGRPPVRSGGPAELETILASDHEWFRVSLDQLEWFYSVVARDDHGGNRQALGQYGRVFAEALRRHRADEGSARASEEAEGPTPLARTPSSNRN